MRSDIPSHVYCRAVKEEKRIAPGPSIKIKRFCYEWHSFRFKEAHKTIKHVRLVYSLKCFQNGFLGYIIQLNYYIIAILVYKFSYLMKN